jgi:catechol 2,3-dioxygenase-like lactoylglutathione lyase family enzyme
MHITHAFAGIAAADYPALRDWYERLFGREPDLVPHDREVAWRLTETGWIYVVEDPERAGLGLLTLLVDDLDAHGEELRERGFEPQEVEDGVRKLELVDPEGNRVSLARPA